MTKIGTPTAYNAVYRISSEVPASTTNRRSFNQEHREHAK